MNLTSKIFLINLLLISFSFGQELKGFGVKAGVVTSNQSWEYSEIELDWGDKNYYGFCFAIFYDIPVYQFFRSNFELAYIQKGYAAEIQTTSQSHNEQGYIDTGKKTFRNRFDNISLTLYGNIKYETNGITPYLLFGPRFDIQINRHIEFGDVSNKFEKYIFGYSFGAGMSFNNFSGYDFLIEIVSSPNINNLYKTDLLAVSNYSYEVKLGIKLK